MRSLNPFLVVVAAAGAAVASDNVVKDCVTEQSWTVLDDKALLDHFLDPSPAFTAAGAGIITGDGQYLKEIEVVWSAWSSSGGPADLSQFRWRVKLYENPAFTLASLSTGAVVTTPMNPDWQTPIGDYVGEGGDSLPIYRAVLDVKSLHIKTTSLQTEAVVAVPESTLPEPTAFASILAVDCGGAVEDWYVSGSSVGFPNFDPAQSLVAVAASSGSTGLPTHLAYKITTFIPDNIRGDLDGDGDVDVDDVNLFETCASAPGVPITDPNCQKADMDGDTDGDQSDFGLMQVCLSGPDAAPDASCFE